MLEELAGRRVLLLQGPAGLFFRRLASELSAMGSEVSAVTFNGGDALFQLGRPTIPFRAPMQEWEGFFSSLLEERKIECVVLFGDMRPLHVVARRVALEHDVQVYVFEEGYVRPNYITLERGGVNGNSAMPKDAGAFEPYEADDQEQLEGAPVGHTFVWAALAATAHAMAATIFWFLYPHYVHHRSNNCWEHTFLWTRGGLRKVIYGRRDADLLERLCGEGADPFFLVPLQVHCDAQVEHSEFASVQEFAEAVVASFADNAPAGVKLVFKHHPADRAFVDYTRLFEELRARHGLGARLIYLHDVHLPTLLRSASGTVVMNSTVGLSSLHHRTPVKALGTAVYDIEGLTSQLPLDAFWRNPGTVDEARLSGFRGWVLRHNQFNGSVWKRVLQDVGPTGVNWNPDFGGVSDVRSS